MGGLASGMKLGLDTNLRMLHASVHQEASQKSESGEKKMRLEDTHAFRGRLSVSCSFDLCRRGSGVD